MLYLTFHSDPGHGWLQVPITLLRESGIKITGFSYYSDKTENVFLEEDCDAPKFKRYLKDKEIHHVIREEYSENSFVRNLYAPIPEDILDGEDPIIVSESVSEKDMKGEI